jgi:L-rhamnose isomerase / sugar isomerase
LKAAFNADVAPILAMARHRASGAIDPIGVYRWSQYRRRKQNERPPLARQSAGIV